MTMLSFSYKENSNKINAPEIVVLSGSLIVSFLSLYKYSFFYPYLYLGYGFYANVFCGALLLVFYLCSANGRITKEDTPFFMLVFIAELYFIFSAIAINGGMRYPGVVLISMMYAFALKGMRIPNVLYKLFFFVVFGLLLLYASNAEGYFELQWGAGGEVLAANSDYVGTLAVTLIIYLDIASKYFKKSVLIRVICVLAHAISFYIIWECKSRASLGGWFVFTILYFLVPYSLIKVKQVGLSLFYGAISFSLFFPIFYVQMSKLFTIEIMGRSGLNRLNVWSYVLEHIDDTSVSLIIGHGTHSPLREILGYPAHNVFYQTWYDTGLIGLLFTLSFLVVFVHYMYNNFKNLDAKQITAFAGVVAYILLDCFGTTNTEAIVIWEFIILGETLRPVMKGD